jgi:hypothetical protein
MKRQTTTFLLLALLGSATAATAGTFTVTLTNGSTFETRYRPAAADWDENLILLATDRGNRIALLKSEIADVTSSVEETGFGYQLDTTTLFVGWRPQDDVEEGEETAKGEDAGSQQRFDFPEPTPSFTVEQFVNPSTSPNIGVPADTGF